MFALHTTEPTFENNIADNNFLHACTQGNVECVKEMLVERKNVLCNPELKRISKYNAASTSFRTKTPTDLLTKVPVWNSIEGIIEHKYDAALPIHNEDVLAQKMIYTKYKIWPEDHAIINDATIRATFISCNNAELLSTIEDCIPDIIQDIMRYSPFIDLSIATFDLLAEHSLAFRKNIYFFFLAAIDQQKSPLVKHILDNYSIADPYLKVGLITAVDNGNGEIINALLGVDAHSYLDMPICVSDAGHCDNISWPSKKSIGEHYFDLINRLFSKCCSSGHTELIKYLMENNYSSIDFSLALTKESIKDDAMLAFILEEVRKNDGMVQRSFMRCCRLSDIRLIKMFLSEHNIDRDTIDEGLCWAGDVVIIAELIPFCSEEAILKKFTRACTFNCVDIIEQILLLCPHLDVTGTNCLHFAIFNRNVELITLLLNFGVDPDTESVETTERYCVEKYFKTGTLFMISNNIVLVKLLLEAGADPNQKNGSALISVCTRGVPDALNIIKVLEDWSLDYNVGGNIALCFASKGGHTEIVGHLLSKGINVDAYDNEALIQSCAAGFVQVANVLIENGADVSARYNSCIKAAIFHGHDDVVRELFGRVNIADESLLFHVSGDHASTIELLLEYGVRNGIDAALIHHCSAGHTEIVRALLATEECSEDAKVAGFIASIKYGNSDAEHALRERGVCAELLSKIDDASESASASASDASESDGSASASASASASVSTSTSTSTSTINVSKCEIAQAFENINYCRLNREILSSSWE